RSAMFAGGFRPHYYCLPVLKREEHREALVRAATSGNPKFFLGTDSAPHARADKETPCGHAGIYTAHAAMELYAEVFERAGALAKLEAFASFHGADFYRLPRNRGSITLRRDAWTVPGGLPFRAATVVARAARSLRSACLRERRSADSARQLARSVQRARMACVSENQSGSERPPLRRDPGTSRRAAEGDGPRCADPVRRGWGRRRCGGLGVAGAVARIPVEGAVLEAPRGSAAIHALLCIRPRDLRKSARTLQGGDGKGPDRRYRARSAGGAARAATPGTGRARGGLFLRDAGPCLDPQPFAAADSRDSRLGAGQRLRRILRRPLAIPAPPLGLEVNRGQTPVVRKRRQGGLDAVCRRFRMAAADQLLQLFNPRGRDIAHQQDLACVDVLVERLQPRVRARP